MSKVCQIIGDMCACTTVKKPVSSSKRSWNHISNRKPCRLWRRLWWISLRKTSRLREALRVPNNRWVSNRLWKALRIPHELSLIDTWTIVITSPIEVMVSRRESYCICLRHWRHSRVLSLWQRSSTVPLVTHRSPNRRRHKRWRLKLQILSMVVVKSSMIAFATNLTTNFLVWSSNTFAPIKTPSSIHISVGIGKVLLWKIISLIWGVLKYRSMSNRLWRGLV